MRDISVRRPPEAAFEHGTGPSRLCEGRVSSRTAAPERMLPPGGAWARPAGEAARRGWPRAIGALALARPFAACELNLGAQLDAA